MHTNVLYTGASGSSANPGASEHLLAPTDQEVAALPHIRRDQITLTKFLGSGAFGEVFEGLARSLPGGQERVAVKVSFPPTLRENKVFKVRVLFKNI
jgi:hypothetical protein